MKAPVGEYVVEYQGRDITADIRASVLDITFTDELQGTSDTLDLRIHDADGVWRDDWFPATGDKISVALGWAGAPLLQCGTFVLDEPEFSGPPDIVTLKGVAVPPTTRVRSRRSRGFDALKLRDLVNQVAGDLGLQVVGEPPDITYTRVTQRDETDLFFLRRLATEHGFAFSIRDSGQGGRLIFFEVAQLEAEDAALALDRTDLGSYRLTCATIGTYSAIAATYKDEATGALGNVRVNAAQGVTSSGDVLHRNLGLQKAANAQAMARAMLAEANRSARTGSLGFMGNPLAVSGVNVDLTGFAKLDGKYAIRKSTHRVDRRQTYTTDVEVTGV